MCTPLIDMSRPSRDPYRSFKSQHRYQNPCSGLFLSLLVYPHLELDIERDEICKALLISKKLNELNDFANS